MYLCFYGEFANDSKYLQAESLKMKIVCDTQKDSRGSRCNRHLTSWCSGKLAEQLAVLATPQGKSSKNIDSDNVMVLSAV